MLSRMPIYRILRCALLALSLVLLAAPYASGQVGDGTRFTGELMRYLGLDPTKRLPDLEKGAVVHNGVPSQEKLAGEIVASGAMLLVRGKEASAVVDAFLHSETFLLVHQVKRYQALRPGASDGPAFAELPLPDVEAHRRARQGAAALSESERRRRRSAGAAQPGGVRPRRPRARCPGRDPRRAAAHVRRARRRRRGAVPARERPDRRSARRAAQRARQPVVRAGRLPGRPRTARRARSRVQLLLDGAQRRARAGARVVGGAAHPRRGVGAGCGPPLLRVK